MTGRPLVRVLRTAIVVTLTLLSVEETSAQKNAADPVSYTHLTLPTILLV